MLFEYKEGSGMAGKKVQIALAGVLSLCAMAIRAQESGAPDATERSTGSRLMEEIIVTAQKREENLQDVPISVNAFSAEMLDARGIADAKELPQVTPGLVITSEAGFAITYLRGVGSDAFVMADPSVANYIDGIYFPFEHGLSQDFGAVDRIEVLKGPQGTLFGRNALGGAINVITKSPDFKGQETSMQSSYGSYQDLRTRVHTNIPLSDSVAISASAVYNDADNYMSGTVAGQPLPRENSRAARVKLRWKPTDDLDINLTGFRLEQQGVSTLFALNSEPRPLATVLGVKPQTGYSGALDNASYFKLSNRVIYGQAEWALDGFDLKLLGSDQHIVTNASYDFDGSPQPLVAFQPKKQLADVQTAEFQILSNNSSWGSEWLHWIGGLYYFKSRQGYDRIELEVLGVDLDSGTAAGMVLPSSLVTALRQVLNPVGLALPPGKLVLQGLVDTKSESAFGQATVNFTDALSLTLGGRLQSETRSVAASNSAVALANGERLQLLNFDMGDLSDTTTSFKPKVSLELRPLDGTMLYASWQQAVKSSAYNTVNIYNGVDYVKPEKMDADEIGIKTDILGGLMRLNAAVFQYTIKNPQVQYVSLLAGGAIRLENAGAERIRGVDFDTIIQLLPSWVDGLVLTGGGAYLDAVYTDYKNGTGFDPQTGILRNGYDFTGHRVVRAPKLSGNLGLSQTLQISGGPLEIAASAYYNSGYSYAPIDDSISNEKAFYTVDARISYLYEAWRLRATVFGKNINGRKYDNGIFNTDFGRVASLAPPAVYGLRLNWDF